MSSRRRGAGTIDTYVSIDICEVMDELSNDDLLAEIKRRNLGVDTSVPIPLSATDTFGEAAFFDGWIDELQRAAIAGEWMHFRIVADRMRPSEPKLPLSPAKETSA